MTSNMQTVIYPQRPEMPVARRLICTAAAPAEWVVNNAPAENTVEKKEQERFSQDDLAAILAQYLF